MTASCGLPIWSSIVIGFVKFSILNRLACAILLVGNLQKEVISRVSGMTILVLIALRKQNVYIFKDDLCIGWWWRTVRYISYRAVLLWERFRNVGPQRPESHVRCTFRRTILQRDMVPRSTAATSPTLLWRW
jgi:hypothetical protein